MNEKNIYPKIQLVKQKRWKRPFIHLIEYIVKINYELELFKKTKKYLLYIYLRYLMPLWYLKWKYGSDSEVFMYAKVIHTFMRDNWKEVKRGDFK